MIVGIAEINADAAAWPLRAAFDCDVRLRKLCLPAREVVGGDRKRNVHRTVAVVRRDRAAGQFHSLQRMTPQEKQQDASRSDVVGA
jgi:hypothetical protein